jgi:hypothetical protein
VDDTTKLPPEVVNPLLPYTNWNATNEFNAACGLVDDALLCADRHVSLLVDALIRAAHLVEEWRGEHRSEIDAYLEVGGHKPVDVLAKDGTVQKPADEILAIVKCVFHRLVKQQWNWRANALRQAFADKKTSDDMTVYFTLEAPTARAKKWSKDHRRAPKPRERLEVAIPKLPAGVTIPRDGLRVLLIEKNGKPMLAIPKPRGSKQAQPEQAAT